MSYGPSRPKLRCPRCQKQTISSVYNSRVMASKLDIWRRRACQECGFRYTTVETRVARAKI